MATRDIQRQIKIKPIYDGVSGELRKVAFYFRKDGIFHYAEVFTPDFDYVINELQALRNTKFRPNQFKLSGKE